MGPQGVPTAVVLLAALVQLAVVSPAVFAQAGSPSPADSHRRMLAALRQIADGTTETNSYIGEGPALRARRELAALPRSAAGPVRWRRTLEVAEHELRLGNETEAIRLIEQALDLVPPAATGIRNHTRYRLGVAYLRLGETRNCAHHPHAEACILPLRGDGIHSDQNPSRRAIAALTGVLDDTPAPTPGNLEEETVKLHLSARWLLNIAYMTIGGYPQSVPGAYLIPTEAFGAVGEMPRFANVAPDLGLDVFDMSGGAAAEDFDGDGYLDIATSTWDTAGQLRLFRNNGDGTFTERTAEAGLRGLFGGLNIIQADYDNDGHVDLLVLRGAWLHQHGRYPNSLLRNNGDGTFTDVTFAAGLGEAHYPTQTAAWGDYDNDGDLDLYVGNESSRALRAPSQLFRNNGDGTFADVAAGAGVLNHSYAKAVIWGDYDGDRLPDLYVSNHNGRNRLYRNNGNGTFTNMARRLRVERPIASFPAWFWDADNDGVLDLFVSAYMARTEHLAASALGLPLDIELARLYRGTGEGGFEEVADRYGLVRPNAAMGANFGDLDNDGYLDFYVGTGYPPYHSLMPNVMYRNRDGQGFADVTYAGGFGHLQKGHGVFFADLDHDGDQDVFEQMGGAYPGDRFGNALYRNPGSGNHWITIRLVGVRSNRSAIGARIRAEIVDDGTRRSVYRHVNSGGSFGANPLRQTIGLGRATRIEKLEMFWPTTGRTQTFTDLPVDRFIRITEDEPAYETVALQAVTFGRGPRRPRH